MEMILRSAALLVSLVVHAFTLAFIVMGCWIIYVNSDFLFAWMAGLVFVGIGVLLRPRPRRLPADAESVARSSAPELYRVAERVARVVGVEPPATVALRDLTIASEYLRVGRGSQVLVIGLPLWLVLSAKQRVVLLAATYAEAHDDKLIIDGALSTLAVWRESLLKGGGAPGRAEAHTQIGATFGMHGTPPGTYEGMGAIGQVLGKVLGLPVLLLEWTLIRLVRGGRSSAARQELARAHRIATDAELTELAELVRNNRFLAPVQAAALRGASVSEIRQSALASAEALASCTNDRNATPNLLTSDASARIDDELRGHYACAIKGFGLIS
ncbi:hypothetical protein GCM10012289_14650 [Nonomuraea cavernae]|uniref:Peptidase M48 domain-containing protein n=2 Tax=Nonomuraea cavernae TaxID=2045107 RepID=A0A917YS51_9ACTN|nr:hypothetical protein GCM10012289_14650 [Nonomuraea cavernae]